MAKMSKKEVERRVQSAVVGFQIPMMSIPKIYAALEAAVREGKEGAELSAIVAASPGVKAA